MSAHDESPVALLTVTSATGRLDLRIGICRSDGRRSFPREAHGCHSCGAHGDDIQAALAPAEGTVVDSIAVAKHRAPGITAPFHIGTIELGEGLIVRALVDDDAQHGAAVIGRVVTTDEGGEWVVFGPRKASA